MKYSHYKFLYILVYTLVLYNITLVGLERNPCPAEIFGSWKFKWKRISHMLTC